MASISYSYNALKFDREMTAPLPETEYEIVRKDPEAFVKAHLAEANKKLDAMPNPHRFSWKWFLIKAGAAGTLITTGIIVNAYDETPPWEGDKAGEWFHMASFVFVLAIVVQPIQYLLASSKASSAQAAYEVNAKSYYRFHHAKAKASSNYTNYLQLVSKIDADEIEDFLWKELRKN
jgi:hypothetical protein